MFDLGFDVASGEGFEVASGGIDVGSGENERFKYSGVDVDSCKKLEAKTKNRHRRSNTSEQRRQQGRISPCSSAMRRCVRMTTDRRTYGCG